MVLATIAILAGTLLPSDKIIPKKIWDYDKFGHFIMFAVWTFLYGLVLGVWKQKQPNLWVIFFWGSFYGILIEFLQFLLPTNRSPELLDFIADAIGSAFAILILKIIFRRSFTKPKEQTA